MYTGNNRMKFSGNYVLSGNFQVSKPGSAQSSSTPTPSAYTTLLLKAEDLTDSSTYNRTPPTIVGEFVSQDQAKFGNSSFNFTGSNYFSYTYANELCAVNQSNSWSLDLWVYLPSYSASNVYAGGQPTMLGNMTTNTTTDWWSFGPTNSGALRFYYYNGNPQYINSTEVVPLNTWTHIAATVDATKVLRKYINGVKVAQGTIVNGNCGNTIPISIGRYANTGFVGYIDEIRMTADDPNTWTDDNHTVPTAEYILQ